MRGRRIPVRNPSDPAAARGTARRAAPLILAHRGASADAPENTLAAFELALEQGADGIECDVRASADGVPVVIHDARLNRTSSGTGRVDAMTASELGRLDAGEWFERRHPRRTRAGYWGARIPQLAEVMDWVRARGCVAYVEVKRGRTTSPGLEERILEIVNAAGVRSQVTLISFHLKTLERLRTLDGTVALGLDCMRPLLAIRHALRVRAEVVLPLAGLASQRFIERAHEAGLRVVAWGSETPRAWRHMAAAGADGLISNTPASTRKAITPAAKWRRRAGPR
jgi:glycerophosphoryl diester phosphodiesterase